MIKILMLLSLMTFAYAQDEMDQSHSGAQDESQWSVESAPVNDGYEEASSEEMRRPAAEEPMEHSEETAPDAGYESY